VRALRMYKLQAQAFRLESPPNRSRIRRPCTLAAVICSIAVMVQLWAASARAGDASLNPSTCRPQALATSDNDIRLAGDDRARGKPVVVPTVVISRLQTAATFLLSRLPAGTAEGLKCEDLFPHTYRISLAHRRQLFVAEINAGMGISYFYFIAHDPHTGAATRTPPCVGARSSQDFGAKDPLMEKPFVSSADLFQNGHPQIVFQERVHNGTLYNAVIYHYFDIGPELALTRVLARETRLAALEPEGAIYIRELTRLTPNRLRLDTFELPRIDAAQRREMGYAILDSPGPGVPFHVAERHPKNPAIFDCLITCQDEPPADDVFLREGYTFYY
jgi:hypothetical protein